MSLPAVSGAVEGLAALARHDFRAHSLSHYSLRRGERFGSPDSGDFHVFPVGFCLHVKGHWPGWLSVQELDDEGLFRGQ